MRKLVLLALWQLLLRSVHAFTLESVGDVSLVDAKTSLDSPTVFHGEDVAVSVADLAFADTTESTSNETTTIVYAVLVDGNQVGAGSFIVGGEEDDVPSEIDVGVISIKSSGESKITVQFSDAEGMVVAETSTQVQVYRKAVALVPLLFVIVFALTTHMVELSLFLTVLIGSCIVNGELNAGFKQTLEEYILKAMTDDGHVYVVLFILFLAGVVGMTERSGGMIGFTKVVASFATTPRTGQLACYLLGCLIFFDDYANTLIAGESMRPLMDSLFVSREKLAFIVDATAAPVASLAPISSWVGFEVDLIDTELKRIIDLEGTDDLGIKTSGFAVFIESIKYRYYPIFMLIFMVGLIMSKRDFGPMLFAERKTQVYKRTDGGDGRGRASTAGGAASANRPRPDQPAHFWNLLVPILLIIFFTFYLLVKTGEDGSSEQSFRDKIESGDSYEALLWGTMATGLLTLLLYLLQVVKNGRLVIPTPMVIKSVLFPSEEEDIDSRPRFLLSVHESVEGFVHGMIRVYPALIILVLAWSVGSMMVDVGADRLFARWILGGLDPSLLPTLSFLISGFMALATGTSWGTMTVLFPLIVVPTYQASEGDDEIFYGTIAGILSGSVAGDHVSPISDTTILGALACDCNVIAHVGTQAWYAVVVSLISIAAGTLPVGFSVWPNGVAIPLGVLVLGCFIMFVCAPVICESGRFDVLTECYVKFGGGAMDMSSVLKLKEDTAKAFLGAGGQEPVKLKEQGLQDEEDVKDTEEGVEQPVLDVTSNDDEVAA